VALTHPDLAGVHFTGSTATFQHLWRTVGTGIDRYRGYPRLVGETGGKDFVVAHPSADVDALRVALVRGAFEYQGQKCSAASRAYVPRSIWTTLCEGLVADTEALPMGDVSDFSNFLGAVIDRRAFDRLRGVLDQARSDASLEVVAGGVADDSEGYFVRPTVLQGSDPTHEIFTTEYFGPILGVFVYDDAEYDAVLRQAADAAPYALTGAIFAQDRAVIAQAQEVLRYSAGNFYVNDKPTGAVVGQQPFGGARASGTNDKAGSMLNLLRWTSPRALKENFLPPTTGWRYPHMG
jgi:1-pyrroline-5-carboxylate dehydrogenase